MDDHVRLLLGQSLSVVALMGATIEYAELARRRARARRDAETAAMQEAALRGLVRSILINGR